MNWKHTAATFVTLWLFLAVGQTIGFSVAHRLDEPLGELAGDALPMAFSYLFHTWFPAILLTGVYETRLRGDPRR